MPSHYNTGEDYLDHEKKKKNKNKNKKKTAVEKLQEKSKGTGWGKVTRQKDIQRLKDLKKELGW